MFKVCKTCNEDKEVTSFRGTRSSCKKCDYTKSKPGQKAWREAHPEYLEKMKQKYHSNKTDISKKRREARVLDPRRDLFYHCKKRAKALGLPFDLQIEDIIIPENCPYLGIPLSVGKGKMHSASPSVDRKLPIKGYVKNNIEVISYRANTLKNNASAEELFLIANRMKNHAI